MGTEETEWGIELWIAAKIVMLVQKMYANHSTFHYHMILVMPPATHSQRKGCNVVSRPYPNV